MSAASTNWPRYGLMHYPLAITGSDTPASGDVVRRVECGYCRHSTLPAIVESQGYDPGLARCCFILEGNHIQSVTVSTDFGTENSFNELGRFGPYAKYASFPVEVTCEFEVMATSGDLVSVSGTAEEPW